jgi:hypothetical protein
VTLRKQAGWELPLEEASALAVRRNRDVATAELLAVDDEQHVVATAAIAPDGVSGGRAMDVAAAVTARGMTGAAGSDFEGVACDGSGRVFVLQEGAARVLAFDRALATVESTIALSVSPDEPGFGAGWRDDDNSRGEGLLLLRRGHILVAKQREPVRLIEFGPRSDQPAGFGPGAALRDDEEFALGRGEDVEYAVLASWTLEPGADVESVNDLAVGADGRLYFVSSKSRCLGRLEADLEAGSGPMVLSRWPLPSDLFQEDEDKAEAVVFAPELGWLIGLDLERSAPNVFQITGVPQ